MNDMIVKKGVPWLVLCGTPVKMRCITAADAVTFSTATKGHKFNADDLIIQVTGLDDAKRDLVISVGTLLDMTIYNTNRYWIRYTDPAEVVFVEMIGSQEKCGEVFKYVLNNFAKKVGKRTKKLAFPEMSSDRQIVVDHKLKIWSCMPVKIEGLDHRDYQVLFEFELA